MTKQEFSELQKKVFAAFVEQHSEERIETCERFFGEKAHNLLYVPDTGTIIEANYEEEKFVFTSSQASLKSRISLGFYTQEQAEFDESYFISEANKLLTAFLRSARTIRNAQNDLLMIETSVNGYPF